MGCEPVRQSAGIRRLASLDLFLCLAHGSHQLLHRETYRLTDNLHAQLAINAISVELGMLDDEGITRTAARFGLGTAISHVRSLDELIALAQRGEPSIVSFPPPAFGGGHIVVLAGGDAQTVRLVDSSRLNMQVMDQATFLKYWRGFSAILQESA